MQQIETIGGERRRDKRYGMQLQLRWKLVRRRRTIDTGTGITVNMSSGGIRFEAGREMPAGLNVELAISWPILLLNVAPMQLFITGRILRSGDGWAAIRTVTHEFRTFASGGISAAWSEKTATISAGRTCLFMAASMLADSSGLRIWLRPRLRIGALL